MINSYTLFSSIFDSFSRILYDNICSGVSPSSENTSKLTLFLINKLTYPILLNLQQYSKKVFLEPFSSKENEILGSSPLISILFSMIIFSSSSSDKIKSINISLIFFNSIISSPKFILLHCG